MSESQTGDPAPWPIPPSEALPQPVPEDSPAPPPWPGPPALLSPELEIFRQKVARGERNFARWSLARADLHGMDLRDVNFYDADLSGANFADADMSRANLGKANLSGANLRGANLSDAFMDGARLDGADTADAITGRPSDQMPASTTPQAPGTTGVARFCIFCGAQLAQEAIFCAACGRPQPQFTVPLAASASRPLTTPLSYVQSTAAPATTPIARAASPLTPLSLPKRSHRPSAQGMTTATFANGLAVVAFLFFPFFPSGLTGPQIAGGLSLIAGYCDEVPSGSTYSGICGYIGILPALLWGIAILAAIAMIAAIVGWINSDDSPKGATSAVLLCDGLCLLGFAYVYFGGQSSLQSFMQALGGSFGFGAGGWLMLLGVALGIVGAVIQGGNN